MMKIFALLALCGLATSLRLPTLEQHLSRRAAVSAAAAWVAAVPLVASAGLKEDIAAEEAELAAEKSKISALDNLIKSLREKAFGDELLEKKDEEASLDALAKGDKSKAKLLADEAAALKKDELANDASASKLALAEAEETAKEKALEAKIKSNKKLLAESEDRDAIAAGLKAVGMSQ
jgi:hypothetical protein